MYGHQFYHASIHEKVKFLNQQLADKKSFNAICEENFLDPEDVKTEMRRKGYYYFRELNWFVHISNLNHEDTDYSDRTVVNSESS
ncbi:hypothetical protein NBRC111894_4268 [Sporolactobacillus inulinus]|uniref:Uncharacterized protein n=1 Tax=Sporolactobacillus inulinus TaxID=2078 RepID=A0A4Y1ZIG0_9BACL|nr:hypothetical protein [Sporolactobacillus inulinus]GAY78714.1 hypothetical protein NBRC111894_4268 [Sporolactobacillus inulinus]